LPEWVLALRKWLSIFETSNATAYNTKPGMFRVLRY
jgi:hypothetical protein